MIPVKAKQIISLELGESGHTTPGFPLCGLGGRQLYLLAVWELSGCNSRANITVCLMTNFLIMHVDSPDLWWMDPNAFLPLCSPPRWFPFRVAFILLPPKFWRWNLFLGLRHFFLYKSRHPEDNERNPSLARKRMICYLLAPALPSTPLKYCFFKASRFRVLRNPFLSLE